MCCDKFHEPEPKSCESGKTIHIFKYYFVISNWGFETMNFIFLECHCNLFIQWKRQWSMAQEAGQSMSTNDDLLSKSLKINMQRVHSDSLLWHRIALIDRLQVKITETPSISFTKIATLIQVVYTVIYSLLRQSRNDRRIPRNGTSFALGYKEFFT